MAEAVTIIIKHFTLMLCSEGKMTSFILFPIQLDEKNCTEQGKAVCYFCFLVDFLLEGADPNSLVKLSKLLCLHSNLPFPTSGLLIHFLMLILHTLSFNAIMCRSSSVFFVLLLVAITCFLIYESAGIFSLIPRKVISMLLLKKNYKALQKKSKI